MFSLLVLLAAWLFPSAHAQVQVLDVEWKSDPVVLEWDCYWRSRNYPTSCPPSQIGTTLRAFVKNTGASTVSFNDATLAGYSLKTVIKRSTATWNPREQNSIYFYWDNPPQDILDAGEPVWFRFDPPSIPPGGVAQAVVRVRFVPTTPSVSLGIVSSAGTIVTNIPAAAANQPRLASIGYSEDLRKIYLHWRRPGGGAAPASVWLDGTNVTALTTTVGDPAMDFAASVISLPNPLPFFSYHVYQGVYADGKTASASQRAWTNKFIYTTYQTIPFTANYGCAEWIPDAARRGFNNVQMNLGDVGSCLGSSLGQSLMRQYGYGYTIQDYGKLNPIDPDMWFLYDEPDIPEDIQGNTHCGTGLRIPCGGAYSAGTLVLKLLEYGAELRARRPNVPTTVNLDGSLRPQSFYTWGPAVDILQFDNYYQVRLKDAYWLVPNQIPLYNNAKFVYAVARTGCSAAEPNPTSHLLYACEYRDPNTFQVWPFPTTESKRMEAYYSLAGGSKGMGYWWFKPGYPSNGLGDQSKPEARALWKEISLIGTEIKTARDLLVKSTPVDLPLAPSSNVWARALASGPDTLILIMVHDNYYNDIAGTHYTPIPNATVTATLPSWMTGATAFEINAAGLHDVGTLVNGNQLQVNLGTLQLTKMIVLTKDPGLRAATQQRYDQQVRPGVCAFAPELCVNTPPGIAQHPANRTVPPGGTAQFTIVAGGTSPLGYRWQKNNVNLNDSGRISGSGTATLTITDAMVSDNGNYRCVVTNAFGNTNSLAATLTVTNIILPPVLLEQPANQAAIPGGTASFSVVAEGTELLSYQWQKNNANLSDDERYDGSTLPTLTIVDIEPGDAGSYRCVVTNIHGVTNSVSATLTVDINYCHPGLLLSQGDFEVANNYSICPGWESYSAGVGTASWAKETGIVRSGLASQRCRNPGGGSGSLLGVRQTVEANVGDAFTFEGWVYPVSNPAHGQQVAMVASWNGDSANPTTNAHSSWNVSTGLRNVWTRLQNLTGNATSTNVTLFLDSRRTLSSQDLTAYWDDVIAYRAFVPPAPLVSVAGSASLNVDLLSGCNATNPTAQFAISIGGGAYTLGTHWVQANGTVSTTPVWQTDVAWSVKTVTGLTTGTPYTFRVRARYSSAIPQPTALGAGATLSPSAAVQPPQLLGQREGNYLTLNWPESPNARLERAGSLTSPAGWATVTNQPVIANGRKSVTLPLSGDAGYFRLVLE